MNDHDPACPVADECRHDDLCPLSRVKAGEAVRIKQLSAPADITQRLRELGFCEDQQVRVVSRQTSFICQVCRTRIGISEELAKTILVEPIDDRA